MSSVTLEAIAKRFGAVEVVRGVDLHVGEGEFVVFVGPSGCGKSTLLRMIAGLEPITSGRLLIGARVMNEVPPAQRGVAMVFQSYALYPHLTVRENIAFGLEVRRVAKAEVVRRVAAAAETLKIEPLMERRPRELSGGQRQRVAIGRAIVGEPGVFLFDEPLSNLDAELRVHMRAEIAALHQRLGATMIYVTHDQVEAMTLADRIVVLREGRVEQIGTPRELYETPRNTFVAQFIGSPRMNLFDAAALADGRRPAGAAKVGIRPEHMALTDPDRGFLRGHVKFGEYLGSQTFVHVELPQGDVALVAESGAMPPIGSLVGLDAPHEAIHRFDADGRRAA